MSVIISTVKNTSLVNSTTWDDMSVNDLISQKNILINRYEFMINQDNGAPLARQIMEGISKLDALISIKSRF